MPKDDKATGILYTILVTLKQQQFWEVAWAIHNVFTSLFRKLVGQNVSFSLSWKHISGVITKWNSCKLSVHENGLCTGNRQWEGGCWVENNCTSHWRG
jgi:hypothetical protein